MTTFQALPPRYASWAPAILDGPIPHEAGATCDDCAMCVKADGRIPTASYFFDPDKKCCSYQPTLANFLVGAILADPDPTVAHGRAALTRRIASRAAVGPLGVGRTTAYGLGYDQTVETLGRSAALICPYFTPEGTCGIWRHRDAVCATYFCRHERGWVGFEFWRALQELLLLVDGSLARWVALQLDVDPAVVAERVAREGSGVPTTRPTGRDLDGVVDDAAWAARWGPWAGRELDYFARCAELVGPLDWEAVLRITGPEVEALARLARRAHGRLLDDATVPERLRVGAFQVVNQRNDGVRCVTHSPSDAIDLPTALLAHLPAFDGRPTKNVLDEMALQHGVGIAPAFLRRLVDWGILVGT